MPEMQQQKGKKQTELGVTALVSEIRCVVDRAKLPNLVVEPSSGSFTFGEKWKPFDHWKEDAVMKFNLNGSIK